MEDIKVQLLKQLAEQHDMSKPRAIETHLASDAIINSEFGSGHWEG